MDIERSLQRNRSSHGIQCGRGTDLVEKPQPLLGKGKGVWPGLLSFGNCPTGCALALLLLEAAFKQRALLR